MLVHCDDGIIRTEYEFVKWQIIQAIEKLRTRDPAAAKELEDGIVYDDNAETFQYTGTITLERLDALFLGH